MTLIYDPSMAAYYVTVKARGMGTNASAIMETTSVHSTVSRYCTVKCTALYILNKLYSGPADRVLLHLRLHQPAGPGGAGRGGEVLLFGVWVFPLKWENQVGVFPLKWENQVGFGT